MMVRLLVAFLAGFAFGLVITALWLSRHPLAVAILGPAMLASAVLILVLSEGPV